MDLDEQELRATRILNGVDKKCKQMNIEEAIENLKIYINTTNKMIENGELFLDTIVNTEKRHIKSTEILLKAYEKEKEKNKNAIKYIKEISPLEVGRAPDGKMMYDHNLNQDEIYSLLEILEEE